MGYLYLGVLGIRQKLRLCIKHAVMRSVLTTTIAKQMVLQLCMHILCSRILCDCVTSQYGKLAIESCLIAEKVHNYKSQN